MLVPLAWLAGFGWFMLSLPEPVDEDVRTEGIVVLTGGPGRLAHGVDLLQRGAGERLLVSGVDPAVQPAELAAELDVDDRLFRCCIHLGKRASNTEGNGAEVAAWTRARGYSSLRIVTAADHMPRALQEIESRLPPSVRLVPDPVPSAGGVVSLAREFTKFAARQFQRAIGTA